MPGHRQHAVLFVKMVAEQKARKIKQASVPEGLLASLIRVRKGPCLSIVLSLQTKSSSRRENPIQIRHAVKRAIQALAGSKATELQIRLITDRLEALVESIDLNHVKEGIGLFVSTEISERVDFSFPVNECIMVGDSFKTRDILYSIQHNKPYYVLSLSSKTVHLFVGSAGSLKEIRDHYFPHRFYDDYEYAKPSRGNSYGHTVKDFEKDKSILSGLRMDAYLKKTDAGLSSYLGDIKSEVILAGSAKLISKMEGQHVIADHVIGKVHGTFDANDHEKLGRLAWKACQDHRQSAVAALIKKIDDTAFNNRRQGIREVWEAAGKGKGLLLLVEKDLSSPGYITEDTGQIRLHAPEGKFRFVEDVVDDAMETVVLKGGRVVLVPENALSKFERIVLLLRYR